MSKLIAFDTNLYFYAIDTNAGLKHVAASALLQRVGRRLNIVPLQVIGELINAILKRNATLLPAANTLIDTIATLAVPADLDDLRLALSTFKQNGMQFWDAVIWATARRNGCTILFSEDYQHGREIGGVTYYNPFQLSPADLTSLLA